MRCRPVPARNASVARWCPRVRRLSFPLLRGKLRANGYSRGDLGRLLLLVEQVRHDLLVIGL